MMHSKAPSHNRERIDVQTTTSDLPGWQGLFENFLRKFKTVGFLVGLSPIVILYIFCLGVSLWPGCLVVSGVYSLTVELPHSLQLLCLCLAMAAGYLLYGITLLLVVPAVNYPFIFMIKPWRGNWYSAKVVPWYIHNALTLLPRYTFLNLCTPTPLTTMFYKMMGMKIGKGTLINTTNISDPCLITLGDYVMVGGSVTMFGHYGQKGYLILARTEIGNKVNLGLKSSVMGDVTVEDGVNVPPHTVLLPKSRVDKNSVFDHTPASSS